MIIKVNNKVQITEQQLTNMLIAELTKRTQSDDDKLWLMTRASASGTIQNLIENDLIQITTPVNLLELGIGIGYFLNTFLRKNTVDIEGYDNNETDNKFNDTTDCITNDERINNSKSEHTN